MIDFIMGVAGVPISEVVGDVVVRSRENEERARFIAVARNIIFAQISFLCLTNQYTS